ncbi:MAG: glycosyltransferase family 39 protein [bacterium]
MKDKLTIKSLAGLLLVLGICFLARVGFQWISLNILRFRTNYFSSVNIYGYGDIAENLAQGKGFSFGNYPTAARPPLYPVVLGLLYKTFGIRRGLGLLFQAVCDTLSCLLIFLMAERLFGSYRSALLAAFLWAVYPPGIAITHRLYPENLFILQFCFFLYSLIKVKNEPSDINWAWWGTQLGLLFLCLSPFFLFPLVFIVYVAFRRSEGIRGFLRAAGLLTCFWALAISPWVGRNYLESGYLISGNTNAGFRLYKAQSFRFRGELRKSLMNWYREFMMLDCTAVIKRLPGPKGIREEYERDQVYQRFFFRAVKKNPARFLKGGLRNWLSFYLDLDYGWKIRSWKSFFLIFSHLSLLILSVVSLGRHRVGKRLKGTPFWLILGYFNLIALLGKPDWREYLANVPLLILLAVPSLVQLTGFLPADDEI